MSAWWMTEVRCDICHDDFHILGLWGRQDSMEYLSGYGWIREEGKDLCPDCAKKLKEEKRDSQGNN